MISLKILEVKNFMAKIFSSEVFDDFYLKELEIHTFTNFFIDGSFNEHFFNEEDLEIREEKNILWGDVKPISFQIIKGNKTPVLIKIILQLSKKMTSDLLTRLAGRYNESEIGGLFINIRYEKGVLHIISGTAIRTFTLDKSLEQEWDNEVKTILKKQGIIFEEI